MGRWILNSAQCMTFQLMVFKLRSFLAVDKGASMCRRNMSFKGRDEPQPKYNLTPKSQILTPEVLLLAAPRDNIMLRQCVFCGTVESRNTKLSFVTKSFYYCEIFTIQHVIYGVK